MVGADLGARRCISWVGKCHWDADSVKGISGLCSFDADTAVPW